MPVCWSNPPVMEEWRMRKKAVVFFVFAISLMISSISVADTVCEVGHGFVNPTTGQWHCNPGPGPDPCLRCWDEITVGGGSCNADCGPENLEP